MDGTTVLTAGNTKKCDLPIGHLDYAYIETCTDVKLLEKIYRILKSGDEGCFPDLERFCEEKLSKLNPNSRSLRKEKPVATKNDLMKDERESLDEDLKSWTDTMKTIEDHLNTPAGPVLSDDADSGLPPIRSGNITLSVDGVKTTKPDTKSSNKRVMPREYRDWDKIDVEAELDKIDTEDSKTPQKAVVGNTVVKDIPMHIDSKGMSDSEKLMKANREKDKGNEAYISSDYKEAITYYSRSISLQPTAASYNNRALVYIKNSDWHKALTDCNTVLSMEPDNVKALLRRGTVHKNMKQYDTALADLNSVIQMEPNNKRAKELIENTEKIKRKEKEERKTKGRRMKIEDVEEFEEIEVEQASKPPPADIKTETQEPVKHKSQKMNIEEVEDNADDDDETADIDTKLVVNGFPETTAAATVVNDKSYVVDPEQISISKLDSDTSDENTREHSGEKSADLGKDTQSDNFETKAENKVESVEAESEKTEPEVSEDSDNDVADTENDSELSVEPSEGETGEGGLTQALSRPVFYMKEYPGSCVKMREEANTLFKSGQYSDALQKYSKVIHVLENMSDQGYNLSLTYSNMAACHLKNGDLSGCVRDCTNSLELVPHAVKPLLRRATAYEHLERYKKAYIDYRHVLLLDSRTEQAHLGTKRCQSILHGRDGPRWREKLQLTKLSPWDIPDIIGLDGNSTSPVPFPTVSASSVPGTSSCQGSSVCSTQGTSPAAVQQTVPRSSAKVSESKPVKEVKEPAKTPQEKFDLLKAKGNDHVKNKKFRDAIQAYSECSDLMPDQTVSYINRALCYIRVNEPLKAEEDCTKALVAEKDNVKALFRRSQARKMLKRYRDGIEDLKHLLSVDPKNTAAKKEMDVLKNYWREELEGMKKNLPSQSSASKPGTSKPESKPCPRAAQSAAGKQRKKIVIEEVDSEGETTPKGHIRSYSYASVYPLNHNMATLPEISLHLFRVLDEIGLNKLTVKKRRDTFLDREFEMSFYNGIFKRASPYIFGSTTEGSTTPGLCSDVDLLGCHHSFKVIQDLSEWTEGQPQLLIVQENTVPGYCRLQRLKWDKPEPMTRQTDGLTLYECNEGKGVVLMHSFFDQYFTQGTRNGPASTLHSPGFSSDITQAFVCTSRLQETEKWARKKRSGGWPTAALIKQVVNEPFFLVPVGNKLSPTKKVEWRISLSLAERCLMFSLNMVQIKCYVIMKMLMKTFMAPKVGKSITSYHCKTALFYCIQNTNTNFWREDNLLQCITRCLKKLLDWVTGEFCPHFILAETNLFDGKVTSANKGTIQSVLERLIQRNVDPLLEIRMDNIGNMLKMKLYTKPNGSPILDSIQTFNLLGYLAMERHVTTFTDDILLHVSACELAAATADVNKAITRLESWTNIDKIRQETIKDELIVFLHNLLGSFLAASSIGQHGIISQEAINMFEATSDISLLLKKASVFYCCRELEKVNKICKRIGCDFKRNNIIPVCRCYECGYTYLNNKQYQTMLKEQYVHYAHCVKFTLHEINCIPEALRHELFRGVGDDIQTRQLDDNWMDLAVVDCHPFLHFLQYMTYRELGNEEHRKQSLHDLERCIIEGNQLVGHLETALNILGQCYEMENQPVAALHCYRDSLDIRPRNNAANWISFYKCAQGR